MAGNRKEPMNEIYPNLYSRKQNYDPMLR